MDTWEKILEALYCLKPLISKCLTFMQQSKQGALNTSANLMTDQNKASQLILLSAQLFDKVICFAHDSSTLAQVESIN